MGGEKTIKSVAIIGAGAAGKLLSSAWPVAGTKIINRIIQELSRLQLSSQRITLTRFEFLSAEKHLEEHGNIPQILAQTIPMTKCD
jgi:hypothetical protein